MKAIIKKHRLKKYFSVRLATNPGNFILHGIIFFNLALFLVSAGVLVSLKIPGTEHMNFFEAMYYSIRIMTTGNIDFYIDDIGHTGAMAAAACAVLMLLGSIFFTGSLIAYLTNFISSFMSYKNPLARQLTLYDHVIILGWNVRGSEIIRNLVYANRKYEIVILSTEDREKIENQLEECIADALQTENARVKEESKKLGFFRLILYFGKNKLRNKLVIIIKQGDPFSSQQLKETSIGLASSVILLGEDIDTSDEAKEPEYGNAQILKTVAQVADMTSAEESANGQNVIVELNDEWTFQLVMKIIAEKEMRKKCSIIPVPVTQTIGNMVSQFALTPDLGEIYNKIFSVSGLEMNVQRLPYDGKDKFIKEFFRTRVKGIPLTSETFLGENIGFYAGDKDEWKGNYSYEAKEMAVNVDVKPVFNDVIIMGYNTKLPQIFASINGMAKIADEKVKVLLVDKKKRFSPPEYDYCLTKEAYLSVEGLETSVRDIVEFFKSSEKRKLTIIILSDDTVEEGRYDDEMFATLVRTREMLKYLEEKVEGFSSERINIVTEIIDPKHYDIVKHYNIKNVIISNRYTSKMITQFAFKSELFELYKQMVSSAQAARGEKREIFTVFAKELLEEPPQNMTAFDFIRSLYENSLKKGVGIISIGLVQEDGSLQLFSGDQRNIPLTFTDGTKVICFKA